MRAAADARALTALETFDGGVPHGLFDELRGQPPAESGEAADGARMVSVCSHAEIAAISPRSRHLLLRPGWDLP